MKEQGTSPPRAWRQGVAFRDGKLYHFDTRSVVVMRLWPQMRAWRRTPCTPWAHTRKWADKVLCRAPLRPGVIEDAHRRRAVLVGPLSPDQYLDDRFRDSAAWTQGLVTIPDRARSIASRFKERRWHILAMMARCPGADDLLQANPALGFALASHWILHHPAVHQPMRSMRALMNKPQARILEWLGFPATESVRRILRKIDPAAMTGRLLPQLCRSLANDQVVSLLRHLPHINEEVLHWVLWDVARSRVTPGFLQELSAFAALDPEAPQPAPANKPLQPCIDRPAPHFYLWRDGMAKSERLDEVCPPVIRSIRQLRRWHREVEATLRRSIELETPLPDTDWAAPPWAGTMTVRPLASRADLEEEGQFMTHCVVMYAAQVARGDYAVYRVLEPVRATLGLARRGDSWVFQQAQGVAGVTLPQELVAEIVSRVNDRRGEEPRAPARNQYEHWPERQHLGPPATSLAGLRGANDQ